MTIRNDVVLNMIVKDEAHVIERCLSSVKAGINSWVIVDTGSTDGTQDLIRQCLQGIPGELYERPWVNFGHNRNEALDLARSSNYSFPDDFALFLDADDEMVVEDAIRRGEGIPYEERHTDGFTLTIEYGDLRYQQIRLARLDRPWRYEGALHEFLTLPGARTKHMTHPRILVRHDGARSRDPETYLKDIETLVAEWYKDSSPRTAFYLAQSYRDAGDLENAIQWYQQRLSMDGWDQERWYSRFQLGVLAQRPDGGAGESVGTILVKAYEERPTRAEPLVALSQHYRNLGLFHIALLYARQAAIIPAPPTDDLFVDSSVYTWRAWDEVAISAWYVDQYGIGEHAARKALKARPWDERLQQNLAFYTGVAGLDQPGVEAGS